MYDCLCVCVIMYWTHGHALLKSGESIDMPFAGLNCVGPRNHNDGDQDLTNPLPAARGNKSAMRPFAKLLWTFVLV